MMVVALILACTILPFASLRLMAQTKDGVAGSPEKKEPTPRERAEALIARMRRAEPLDREKALREFLELGPGMIDPLRRHIGSGDPAFRTLLERALNSLLTRLLADFAEKDPAKSGKAREALLRVGAAAAYRLDTRYAAMEREVEVRVGKLFSALYGGITKKLAGENPRDRETARHELLHAAHLAQPLLEMGLRDKRPEIRKEIRAILDTILRRYLGDLNSPDASTRNYAREGLYGLAELAIPSLEKRVRSESAHERYFAKRLLRRIHFRISRRLYNRIGHLLEGYEQKDWRERRSTAYEIEKLGGKEAIPTLRRIVLIDRSYGVKLMAAQCLARLKDPFGIRFLEKVKEGIEKLRESPEITAAIYMDQGIQYLKLKKYAKSIEQFKKVLKIQPDNDTAYYNMACAYSLWGKIDDAIECLKKSVERGFTDVVYMESDGDLDNIRNDTRYLEIVEKMKQKARKRKK
jgi:tetratricopeptide (TPR) repeat protein